MARDRQYSVNASPSIPLTFLGDYVSPADGFYQFEVVAAKPDAFTTGGTPAAGDNTVKHAAISPPLIARVPDSETIYRQSTNPSIQSLTVARHHLSGEDGRTQITGTFQPPSDFGSDATAVSLYGIDMRVGSGAWYTVFLSANPSVDFYFFGNGATFQLRSYCFNNNPAVPIRSSFVLYNAVPSARAPG